MTRDLAALVARVLLVLLFLLSGVGKVMAFGGTVSYIASRGLPLPALETAIAVAVELGAGLLLLVGWKTRWASMILAVFAVATGILFHAYWADTDAAVRMGDYINFWKNISIAGGFLMAFAFGPGGYSVDRG